MKNIVRTHSTLNAVVSTIKRNLVKDVMSSVSPPMSSMEGISSSTTAPTNILADENLMGYHLLADVIHDFPQFHTAGVPYYNIGSNNAAAGYSGRIKEDEVLTYFSNAPGNSYISQFGARQLGELKFTIPEKTASFTDWTPPRLFQGENINVGMIQDAGHFITPQLGCKNVLTFGSILDPARKPISPDTNPIWFEPTTNAVDIPLNMFGFDPNVIQTLHIENLRGAGLVNAVFRLPSGQVDAIERQPLEEGKPLKSKPINNTKPDQSGYFTSIGEVGNIEENLLTATGTTTIDPNEKVRYYIGKTLGDVTLVASAMPSFGGVPNPYYGASATTGWKSWLGTTDISGAPPTILALKTGDRLNWLRAVLFNVPAILETGARVRTYKYFPGTPTLGTIRQAILNDFDNIETKVTERYTKLVNSLTDLRNKLVEENTVNPTNFAPGGQATIRKKTVLPQARALLDQIIGRLVGGNPLPATETDWPFTQSMDISLRNAFDRIYKGTVIDGNSGSDIEERFLTRNNGALLLPTLVNWLRTRRNQITEARYPNTNDGNAELRDFYQRTLEIANMCSPQSTSIFLTKGTETYLSSKIVVVNIPRNLPASSSSSSSISSNAAGGPMSITNGGKSRKKRKQKGGVNWGDDEEPENTTQITTSIEAIRQTVGEVVGVYNGTTIFARFNPSSAASTSMIDLKDYVYINDFWEYVNRVGGRPLQKQEILQYVNEIYIYRNTDRFLDYIFLNSIVREFEDFCDGNDVTCDKTTQVTANTSTRPIVLFNAYTQYVNAQNASSFATISEDTPQPTQASQDFEAYEEAFLNTIGLTRRPPPTSSFSAVPASSTNIIGLSVHTDGEGSTTPMYQSTTASSFSSPSSSYIYTQSRSATPVSSQESSKEGRRSRSQSRERESRKGERGEESTSIQEYKPGKDPRENLRNTIGQQLQFEGVGKATKGHLGPADKPWWVGGRRHTFRRKRPTSKKNVESTGSSSTRNARLRKQPRTRTTYRVRKHTGKSKTRRQRNKLDRV